MEYIELTQINIKGNRCEYCFNYPEVFEPYIADKKQKLFFELPNEIDIHTIPESILAVPFVGSMLCVTMMLGVGIKVRTIDKAFYESIPRVQAAFNKMFPYTDFCLDVQAGNIENTKPTGDERKTSLFFTGGLDATSALFDKIKYKPTLINIWGGDMLLTDKAGHEALERYILALTKQIGNDFIFMKSNCRRFFNELMLEKLLKQILRPEDNHGWWASIAHILSMTATISPILYSRRICTHYIGSGYSIKSKGFDCNNVDMVNAIKVAGGSFIMVEEDLDRSEKAKKIVDYCKRNNLKVELKVCWYSKASVNCSHCEKCYRTITEILCNHADPNDYGFKFDANSYRAMHKFLKYNYVNDAFWEANKTEFQKEYDYWKNDKNMSWILTMDFNNHRRIRRYQRLCRIKSILWRIKHKLFG